MLGESLIVVVPRQAAKHVHASRSGGRITRCNLTFSTATVREGTASEVSCPQCRKRVNPTPDPDQEKPC